MSERSHLSETKVWRIIELLKVGQSQVVVAEAMEVSQSFTNRMENQFFCRQRMHIRPGKVIDEQKH